MVTYAGFRSRCTVKIKTWRNEEFDLTGDLVQWSTTKSLTQPEGTFSISTVPRKHASKNWAELVKPMDYVEIRASETGQLKNGEYPIIMRGFVDFAGDSFDIGATGGPVEPRILITGRDYVKLFEVWQILYLYTQNGGLQTAIGQSGMGLFYNYNIPGGSVALTQFFDEIFSKIVDPVIKAYQADWVKIPSLSPNFVLPGYQMGITTEIRSFQGSYWNLFSYFSSPPFGEVFVWDDVDAPVFTARVTPYRTLSGQTPSPGLPLDVGIEISTADINMRNIGYSDQDVYTYFLTTASDIAGSQGSGATLSVTGKNGVNTPNQSLYGTRPLIADTSWINTYDATDMVKIATELDQWLMGVMKDNMSFRQGMMQLKGRSGYRIGQYAKVIEWNEEFYISSVNHTFVNFAEWTTQLNVTRGRKL